MERGRTPTIDPELRRRSRGEPRLLAVGMTVRAQGLAGALVLVAVAVAARSPLVPPSGAALAEGPPRPVDVRPAPTAAHLANPVIRTSVEWYEVRGATAQQLLREMRSRGPESGDRRFFGHTAWQVNWTFRYRADGRGCRITRTEVTADIVVTLPRWTPPPGAPASLRQEWEAFLAALRVHEDGHRDRAVRTAYRIRDSLGRMQRPTCPGLEQEANGEGHRLLDRLRADNRRYDEETGHGRTQGVVWPRRAPRGGAHPLRRGPPDAKT